MKFVSKVEQEIEGNKWFEKNRQTVENNHILSKNQLKTIIREALTYYLIDAISFRMFIETIDRVGERPEIRTMPDIEETIQKLLSLSQYASNPEMHRETIIDTFHIIVTKISN